MTKERWRLLVAVAATLAIVVPLAWMWQASRMTGEYSVMEMGYADYGGGPVSAAGHGGSAGTHGGHGATSVADLVADPDRRADVTVDLVAEAGTITLADAEPIELQLGDLHAHGVAAGQRDGELVDRAVAEVERDRAFAATAQRDEQLGIRGVGARLG